MLDRSARPLYVSVREYMQTKYPDELLPNMYFMNPQGFKACEEMTPEEIDEIVNYHAFKEACLESKEQIRSREKILAEFEATYKKLMQDKDKPVLIFDTCIHTGRTMESVKQTFDRADFSDVRIGTIRENCWWAKKVEADYFITKDKPTKGCCPFDTDQLVEKTFNHVYSKRTEDPERRKKAWRLRAEIKKIMADFLAKE